MRAKTPVFAILVNLSGNRRFASGPIVAQIVKERIRQQAAVLKSSELKQAARLQAGSTARLNFAVAEGPGAKRRRAGDDRRRTGRCRPRQCSRPSTPWRDECDASRSGGR